jgi:hypothetical protein
MPNLELGISLLKSACTSEAKDIAVDWAELGLDALLKEGVLKDAPMLGTVVRICAMSKTVRDALFVQKVWEFLRACPKFNEAEQAAFTDAYLGSLEKAQRLGNAIVLILDRLDDLEKPAMLAKVFTAFVRGQISYDAFRRLSAGIDSASAEDLKAFGRTAYHTRGIRRAIPNRSCSLRICSLDSQPQRAWVRRQPISRN